jgi:tRNA G26 N,N-dimethylase Trm1
VAPFLQAIREAGFKAVPTHFSSRGIRTDAPASAMQKVLRSLTQAS